MSESSTVDLVIVGAGAAGLGAARTSQDSGLSFVVLEAMDRIGGRADTDHSTFVCPGISVAIGCILPISIQ